MKDEADKLFAHCVRLQKELNNQVDNIDELGKKLKESDDLVEEAFDIINSHLADSYPEFLDKVRAKWGIL